MKGEEVKSLGVSLEELGGVGGQEVQQIVKVK